MSLPELSIRRPVAVAMFFTAVIFLGVISFTRLPVDLLPDIAYPKLVIYTGNPDTGPAEIERFITEPIEAAVGRVPGVEHVESYSREGASTVVLRFAWGTDMDFAALNVRENLDGLRGSLPERAERPVVLRTDPRSEPIMAISVAADIDLWSLKDLTESVFRRRLEQIDGVAQAAITGGLEREIHIDVDAARLESHGITIDQIATALAAANTSAQSGTIRRGRFRYALRTLGELQSVDEIRDIVLAQPSTDPDALQRRVLLRDVATVEDGFRERESIARYNGREAIGLLIFKESGANTVRVAERVEEVLDELRSEYTAVTTDVAMSQAGFISSAIANLIQEMILGAVLAFVVLVLFLRDPRFPFAISFAIPISIIATFALFHLTGVSLNIMSLGGLALGIGMLVDNSIVVIENTFRHREKGLGAAAAAALGTKEVQRAIAASTLTTIAVFGPIIYVEGVAGEMFASLSFAVAFSLIASLVVALTQLPTMAARWTGPVRQERKSTTWYARWFDAFDRVWDRAADRYQHVLATAMVHRTRVLIGAFVMLVLTVPIAMILPRSVLPDVDQSEYRARLELPRGTPLEMTAEIAGNLEDLIREDAAVDAVFSRIGRQAAVVGMDEEHSGLNTALLEVRLRPGELASEAIERLRPKLSDFDAGTLSLETGHATALGQLLGASEADLAVRVRGENLDSALAYAALVSNRIGSIPEVTNVRVGVEQGQPEFVIEIDRERAAAARIDPSEIVAVIENAMRGRASANPFVAFDRKVPIIVRLPDEERRSLETLDRLAVRDIPIRELVNVRESIGPVEIQRLDQSRFVPVYADAVDNDVDAAVSAVRAALSDAPPPPPMRFDIGGENEEMRRSFRELAFAFLLALLLVYMILGAEFESLVQPFTILLSVPLGLIGAILALWLAGAGINTISLIGIVILVGIVDNNAVVMIDFINHARADGASLRDAILEAGQARLRPIVMTTLTTMLAILPMMLGLGAGAGLQAPLAIAVFGGLFTATALTLIVVPIVYQLITELPARAAARRSAATASTERVVMGDGLQAHGAATTESAVRAVAGGDGSGGA